MRVVSQILAAFLSLIKSLLGIFVAGESIF
jgi:hypothetical protein